MAEKPTYEELAQRVKDLEKAPPRSEGSEGDIRASEEKFFKAFHSGPLLMTISSIEDGRYLDVNERFISITGYDRKETIGATSVELGLISQDDRATLKDKLLQDGLVRDMELTLHKKNGEPIYGLYCGEIITIGGKQRLLSIAQDISERKKIESELQTAYDELEIRVEGRTNELIKINEQLNQEIHERKQAEEQLRWSEERYHTVYSVAPLAFVLWDCDCRITDWNKRAEEMFGWSADEVLGRNFFEFLIPEGARPHVEQIIEILLAGTLPRHSINENFTKNGEIIICEWNSSILYDKEDQVRGALSLALDITERKRTEEALKGSEGKYRSLFENANDSIFIVDPVKLTVLDANENAIIRLGYSRKELLRLTLNDISGSSSVSRNAARLRKLKRKGSIIFEHTQRNKNGQEIPIEVSSKIISYNGRKVIQAFVRDITDRKRAESALLESEKRLSQIIHGNSIATFVIDKNHKITHWNMACENLTGVFAEEMLGTQNQWRHFYKQKRPTMADLVVDIASDDKMAKYYGSKYKCSTVIGGAYEAEDFFPQLGDTGKWLLFKAAPLKDAHGEILGAIETFQDITERKQVEEYLRQSEEKFHSLYSAMNEGVALHEVIYDGAGKAVNYQILDVNPAYESILGIKRDKALSCTASELYGTEEPPYLDAFAKVSATGEATSFETYFPPMKKHFRLSAFSPREGEFATVFSDITDRKLAEEALRQSEEKFRSIFEIAGAAIATFLPEGNLLEVNPALCKFLGYTEAELLKLKVEDITHPDDRKRTRRSYDEIMAGQSQSIKYEKRYLRKDGSTVWGHVDVACVLGSTSKPIYCVGLTQDITERKKMEQALQAAHDDLEKRVAERTAQLEMTHDQLLHSEKLSAIGRLSASIAHEFNNPLFGIRNVLGGIKKGAALDEEDTELVDMALQECDRIKYLIQDLQDFNRPTSGIKAPVDIHKSIDSILLLLNKEFKNKKIMVEKDYNTTNTPNICAVGDQIKQVLLNLLNNSSDAMSAGGGTITITTHLLNKKVAIHIQDTGTGIKPEDMEHIFEPFFTTKPEVKGTGLGLSVSYGIIKRHGGRIDVQSEVGQGSIFTIILPIEEASK